MKKEIQFSLRKNNTPPIKKIKSKGKVEPTPSFAKHTRRAHTTPTPKRKEENFDGL